MAINYIDVGIVANDGTGDSLREAMIKINDNFEEIDLRVVEETIIANAGDFGTGIYKGKIDGENQFKRIVAGQNVTLTNADNYITINAAESLDQLVVISDSGSITVERGQTLGIKGGEGINTEVNGQQVILNLDTTGIVSQDTSPLLSANLEANNKNITGANTITATTFRGAFEGTIWGYDVRTFGSYFQGFDFGGLRPTYNNAIELILGNTDVDFETIVPPPPSGIIVDLGIIPPQ